MPCAVALCNGQRCRPGCTLRAADGLSTATPVRFTNTVTPTRCSGSNRLSHRGFLSYFLPPLPVVVSPSAAKHGSSAPGSGQLQAGPARSSPSSRLSTQPRPLLETSAHQREPLGALHLPAARASRGDIG